MSRLMKRWLALVAVVAGSVWLGAIGLTAPDKKPAGKAAENVTPTQRFMRAKLTDSQQVLEGLTTENYKLIEKGADHMAVMSRAQEWNVIAGPQYLQHSAEFRRCCEDLKKRAEKRNLDACALSHLQLTMSCINCHRFVRSTRIARNELLPNLPEDRELFAAARKIASRRAPR